jgi:hypothetical protein
LKKAETFFKKQTSNKIYEAKICPGTFIERSDFE